jgi:hypothetical protein
MDVPQTEEMKQRGPRVNTGVVSGLRQVTRDGGRVRRSRNDLLSGGGGIKADQRM